MHHILPPIGTQWCTKRWLGLVDLEVPVEVSEDGYASSGPPDKKTNLRVRVDRGGKSYNLFVRYVALKPGCASTPIPSWHPGCMGSK